MTMTKFSKFTVGFLWVIFAIIFYWLAFFIGNFIIADVSNANYVKILSVFTITSSFLVDNQYFLATLFGFLLSGALLLIIMPKKYREMAYKVILTAVILFIVYEYIFLAVWGGFIFFWDTEVSFITNIIENVLSVIRNLAYFFQALSIKLLCLSILEFIFKNSLKPVLIRKKWLVALIVIAVISILALFGFYLAYQVEMPWLL